mmetsp:Transcript_113131/g.325232  ORF Transcript_113131/g.325232 Transcript_113131/m.325232 type:complete len:300 (-) Transcript_113131:1054-1953(-)
MLASLGRGDAEREAADEGAELRGEAEAVGRPSAGEGIGEGEEEGDLGVELPQAHADSAAGAPGGEGKPVAPNPEGDDAEHGGESDCERPGVQGEVAGQLLGLAILGRREEYRHQREEAGEDDILGDQDGEQLAGFVGGWGRPRGRIQADLRQTGRFADGACDGVARGRRDVDGGLRRNGSQRDRRRCERSENADAQGLEEFRVGDEQGEGHGEAAEQRHGRDGRRGCPHVASQLLDAELEADGEHQEQDAELCHALELHEFHHQVEATGPNDDAADHVADDARLARPSEHSASERSGAS